MCWPPGLPWLLHMCVQASARMPVNFVCEWVWVGRCAGSVSVWKTNKCMYVVVTSAIANVYKSKQVKSSRFFA